MVLQDQTWPWTEELDALSLLEAQDLVNFVPMLLSRTFVECYIAGINIIPCMIIFVVSNYIIR